MRPRRSLSVIDFAYEAQALVYATGILPISADTVLKDTGKPIRKRNPFRGVFGDLDKVWGSFCFRLPRVGKPRPFQPFEDFFPSPKLVTLESKETSHVAAHPGICIPARMVDHDDECAGQTPACAPTIPGDPRGSPALDGVA